MSPFYFVLCLPLIVAAWLAGIWLCIALAFQIKYLWKALEEDSEE